MSDSFTPNKRTVEAWRAFPSDYEFALLDRWLQGLIGTSRDYEARLALNVIAQRKYLADGGGRSDITESYLRELAALHPDWRPLDVLRVVLDELLAVQKRVGAEVSQ